MSPEICIIVDQRDEVSQRITVSFFYGGKADAVIGVEGSRPGCAKASIEVTTGVEEQGMSSRG
jgi:hypothetical protein